MCVPGLFVYTFETSWGGLWPRGKWLLQNIFPSATYVPSISILNIRLCARIEKVAVRTPLLPTLPLIQQQKAEILILSKRVCCLYLLVHEGKNRIEKQEKENVTR